MDKTSLKYYGLAQNKIDIVLETNELGGRKKRYCAPLLMALCESEIQTGSASNQPEATQGVWAS